MSVPAMQVKLLSPAELPKRIGAGFAVFAAQAARIPARQKGIVKTGLAIAIPEETYARVAPLHGLADRMIQPGAGVVDYDYRGEVGVVLFNHGAEDFIVSVGDPVAQIILQKISMAGCQEVQSLDETARGSGGYGSTGISEAVSDRDSKRPRLEETSSDAMLVKRLSQAAVLPVRGSVAAAGFDLSAAEATVIPAGGKGIVKTGLAISIPEGTYARVAPRSGLAAKKMIHTGAGVVDYDYRGEVGAVLFNYGSEDFAVAVGDRVAQLILEQISMAGCSEVQSLKAKKEAAEAMLVKRLNQAAQMPVRGSAAAAGFDLAAAEATVIPAGSKGSIKTGLAISTPKGTYARVAPRSGLAAKKMIHIGAGIVDNSEEVEVLVFNHGREDFVVAAGDRVAQLILEKTCAAECVEVESLDETLRGAGGFGSTGVAAPKQDIAVPAVSAEQACRAGA